MVRGPKTGSWGTYSPNSEIVGNFNETSTKGTLENGGMGQVMLGPRPSPEVRQQVPLVFCAETGTPISGFKGTRKLVLIKTAKIVHF